MLHGVAQKQMEERSSLWCSQKTRVFQYRLTKRIIETFTQVKNSQYISLE